MGKEIEEEVIKNQKGNKTQGKCKALRAGLGRKRNIPFSPQVFQGKSSSGGRSSWICPKKGTKFQTQI